jgi:D-glycero-beta-D-manno-heptose-7-phosphate kinase
MELEDGKINSLPVKGLSAEIQRAFGRTDMEEIKSDYDPAGLMASVDRFYAARILVLGDVIMDEYIWGKVSRISPEAPVPVVAVNRETKMLGGAANVILNMATLGARPVLCGVIGDDATGKELLGEIEKAGLVSGGLIVEPGRPTSIKTRVVAQNQQVVRFDRESRGKIQGETTDKILDFVKNNLSSIDAVVVSDYGKGVVSNEVMKGLVQLTQSWKGIVAVDPKIGNFQHYSGVDVITPNHHEAGTYCGFEIEGEETLLKAGRRMLEKLECRAVLITQGQSGMTLFEREGEVHHIPTVARKVYDVTGAGDTVIGTLCLGLVSGLDMRSSALISNFAAGIVVGEIGTSTVKAEDLKRAIGDGRPSGRDV